MSNELLDQSAAQNLSIKAGTAFQPRSPINTREFFAGRWEQLTTVIDSVSQAGLHIIIFGERGVGKTSLANIIDPFLHIMEENLNQESPEHRLVIKVNTHQGDLFHDVWRRAFDEVSWIENKPRIGFDPDIIKSERVTLRKAFNISDSPTIDDVRRTLSALKRSVFIFDEFDRGTLSVKGKFTDLIKTLSDYAVDSTVVLVGVSDTVDDLVQDHASIVRSIVQIQLPRMNKKELGDILVKASDVLNIGFDEEASSFVIRLSQGLPHYTHLIGLHATRKAAKRCSRQIKIQDVYQSFNTAVQQAIQSIREKYLKAIHSAHKDALYDKVILACSTASSTRTDALGYFHPVDVAPSLGNILNRDNVTIATFQKHINEFCEDARGPIMERTGIPRAYKYRFLDPLLPPFVFMTALSDGLIDSDKLKNLTSSD